MLELNPCDISTQVSPNLGTPARPNFSLVKTENTKGNVTIGEDMNRKNQKANNHEHWCTDNEDVWCGCTDGVRELELERQGKSTRCERACTGDDVACCKHPKRLCQPKWCTGGKCLSHQQAIDATPSKFNG